jgi:hypothetical protein
MRCASMLCVRVGCAAHLPQHVQAVTQNGQRAPGREQRILHVCVQQACGSARCVSVRTPVGMTCMQASAL